MIDKDAAKVSMRKVCKLQHHRRVIRYILFEVQDRRDGQRRRQDMSLWETAKFQYSREKNRRLLCEVQDR